MERNIGMRKVFGVLAFLSFFLLLGVVGSVEQNQLSLGIGTVYMFLSLGVWVLFSWLAGAFDYSYTYEEDENEESRPRCSRPKGGKRKSSRTAYHKGGQNATLQR